MRREHDGERVSERGGEREVDTQMTKYKHTSSDTVSS